MISRYCVLLLALISCITCAGQTSKSSLLKSLRIEFRNVVDSTPMQLGSSYKNSFGEEYTIKTFKYYVSNISLKTAEGKTYQIKGSHLINEADSISKVVLIQAPRGDYKELSFLLGVDSIYNVSGTQTGDLDPIKGMFWTWNSGYIMAKLEAISTSSSAVNHKVEYHIGGYKVDQKVSRKVVLMLPSILATNDVNKIAIEANANRWFDGEHELKIATNAVCTTPGKLATAFADNYSLMFKISATN